MKRILTAYVIITGIIALIFVLVIASCAENTPTAPTEAMRPAAEQAAQHDDPQIVWTTTPQVLRQIADRMDAGDSITGSGVFHYAQAAAGGDSIVVEIMKEGF